MAHRNVVLTEDLYLTEMWRCDWTGVCGGSRGLGLLSIVLVRRIWNAPVTVSEGFGKEGACNGLLQICLTSSGISLLVKFSCVMEFGWVGALVFLSRTTFVC